GGGHSLMHESRFRSHDFRQMSEKGDHVVLGFALDLIDPGHVEGDVAGLGPDRFRGFFRNHPEFRQRVRRMRLDLEPDLETRLRLPDGGHFWAGIAGNHQLLLALGVTPRFSRSRWLKPPVRSWQGGKVSRVDAWCLMSVKSLRRRGRYLGLEEIVLLAVFADIHANRQAFSACLNFARARGAERMVCLGDYVGYGADPEWTVETVMDLVENGAIAVRGNHDNAVGIPSESM